jgi:oligopeptide transport system ATP-binding protein
MTPYAAIEFSEVSKDFQVGSGRRRKSITALHPLSFVVSRGQSWGIAGESGSGKSTLARLILGLEEPSTGEVFIDGNVLPGRLAGRQRKLHARRVQMVFQDPYSSLDARQSAFDMLDEVQRVHFQRDRRVREKRSRDLVDAVGLSTRQGSALPRELSGGQRQRLAIARVLAVEASIVVLDEPVSSLDVSVQAQVLNLLCDLRAELGLTYVFVSHDLAVISQVCDHLMVLRQGHLSESGEVARILTRPAAAYTRRLLESIPRHGMALS